ncbi:alpha/beta hydrolase [Ectothiorhodospiraceae bacterium WFHF3C12]|nr:alpha/beta hydrolase [Ectothiorhodospiraceae bacterium WFHF3C12]
MEDIEFELSDGSVIDVTVRGDGPVLFLLHGWTAAARDWAPAIEYLAGHFRCIAWSARPHTACAEPGIDRMAADLHELLAAMAPDGACVCGHSMGAMTLMEYIGRFGTARLRGLSFIDQAPRLLVAPDWGAEVGAWFTEAENQRFIDALRADFVTAALDLVAHSRVPDDGGSGPGVDYTFLAARRRRLGELDPDRWIRVWQSFIHRDYRETLARIDVPTLLVFGGRSRYYAPGIAEFMHSRIAGSRLEVYEEAGHAPHVEQPQRYLRDLLRLQAQTRTNNSALP